MLAAILGYLLYKVSCYTMLDTLPFTSDTGEARAAPPRGPPRPPLPLPRNVMRDLRAGLLLAGAPLPLPEWPSVSSTTSARGLWLGLFGRMELMLHSDSLWEYDYSTSYLTYSIMNTTKQCIGNATGVYVFKI